MIYALSMAKRKKKEHDFAVRAFNIVQKATGQDGIDYAELGRKGGLKGGKVRAERLSPARRSEIAKKAAQTRWHTRA